MFCSIVIGLFFHDLNSYLSPFIFRYAKKLDLE